MEHLTYTSAAARGLVELHCHVGQSLEPHVLWAIAHEQGIRLPTKDYAAFYDLVTLNQERVTWDDYHRLFHLTELIQSSPVAMERALYEIVSGAYRVSGITLLEPSFNPMFRNRGGERDLDAIILAALRGMECALVEFPQVRAGILLFLDRRLSPAENTIIVKKAIKYRSRGVVGIDLAGPAGPNFRYEDVVPLYEQARAAGLRTTVHTGEDGTAEEMAHVLRLLPLDRVNHGFRASTDPALMAELQRRGLTLCLCPTSNLRLGFIRDMTHMREVLRSLLMHGVRFCLNTDNPAMLRTTLPREMQMMLEHDVLTQAELDRTVIWAREAAFVPTEPGRNLYL
jgi:adenosine deaminase